MSKLRVVELYAGIARTWEAFRQQGGYELGLLIDNDQLAIDTYTDNFPRAPYWRRDLRFVTSSELEARAGGHVDILLGCPPCQGFSDTGKRDPEDPRNGHIGVFAHLACALKPYAIAMENVPLLATSPRFARFIRKLEKAGYLCTTEIINAALYGSCQTRQRLLLVAIRKDAGKQPRIPKATHGGSSKYFAYQARKVLRVVDDPIQLLGIAPGTMQVQGAKNHRSMIGKKPIPTVGEILSGLPAIGSADAQALSHSPWYTSRSMKERMSRVHEGGRWKGGLDHYSHAYGRLHRKGLARTITTYFANPGSGRFWHPTAERPLTIREAARIQGIEDDFLFQGPVSKTARLIGNALDFAIAKVARATVEKALKQILT